MKAYLVDIDRLRRITDEELRRYQDQQLRKIVHFADTVPLYHEKFKKSGVSLGDITGIADIQKLPIVSKEDFKKYYPDGIIPSDRKKSQYVEIATSGTTGKSLALYVDMFDIVMGLFGYLRTVKEYGLNWRKSRLTIIGDFAPHTAESGYIQRGLSPRFNTNFLFKNIQWLNTNDEPKKIIQKINQFQPEFIGGYVGMLGHLALLKEQGMGKAIAPQVIAATGSVLDYSLREFIETTFNAHVFEVYGATETGPVAFECKQGGYHIFSDLLFLEVVKNNRIVAPGEAGHVIVTKLYGEGTPIIRYNAINDIVSLHSKKCSCSMVGDLLEKIYGRDDLALFLPGGRVLLPSSFSEIYSKVLYGLKTTKLKETMIIQHSLENIEIQVVIDEKQHQKKPSVKEIISLLKTEFEKKVGPDIKVDLRVVKKIDRKGARIVSKVDKQRFEIKEYI